MRLPWERSPDSLCLAPQQPPANTCQGRKSLFLLRWFSQALLPAVANGSHSFSPSRWQKIIIPCKENSFFKDNAFSSVPWAKKLVSTCVNVCTCLITLFFARIKVELDGLFWINNLFTRKCILGAKCQAQQVLLWTFKNQSHWLF